MRQQHRPNFTCSQTGSTLLEILVSLVILLVGLLGLAGLQARASNAQLEAYQRNQAVALLGDMLDRISTNRKNAASYVTTTPQGTGNASADCSTLTGAQRDLCDWNNALLGAQESLGGSSVGAMIGARGCVTQLSATAPQRYQVAVVWQGLTSTLAPASTTCGDGLYGDTTKRRAVIGEIVVGCLRNDPTTGACS